MLASSKRGNSITTSASLVARKTRDSSHRLFRSLPSQLCPLTDIVPLTSAECSGERQSSKKFSRRVCVEESNVCITIVKVHTQTPAGFSLNERAGPCHEMHEMPCSKLAMS